MWEWICRKWRLRTGRRVYWKKFMEDNYWADQNSYRVVASMKKKKCKKGNIHYKYINIIVDLSLVLTVLGPSLRLTLGCYKHTLLQCMWNNISQVCINIHNHTQCNTSPLYTTWWLVSALKVSHHQDHENVYINHVYHKVGDSPFYTKNTLKMYILSIRVLCLLKYTLYIHFNIFLL
jgi:hypothetical protein